MKKFNSRKEAFASQNYDPLKVKMEGVPEHIVAAALGFINLCVAHDAVNPEFVPDYTNYDQDKFNAVHKMGSPSGVGCAYLGYGRWHSGSSVGARLVSESDDACEHLAEICHEDYVAMKVYERQVKK